jgi:TonB-dependent receptor
VKTSIQTYVGLRARIRHTFTVNSSAPAHGAWLLAAAIAGASGAASAQQAPKPPQVAAATEEQPQEIVVVGIRAAIESAIATKQQSDEIVEAISAEDIGKLPDTSIAESISRLPGLTSQRSDGRASDISIRGTDPQFATALLNGRQQVSTADNRSIQYDQYPSELISGVIVYKTPDASLIGQGLAGTIALQTTRPLEFGQRAIALNFRGEKNSDADLGSNSKNNGYRASISYIDQFFDHTLGITVGYARLYSPIVGKELGTYDPWSANGTSHAGVPADVYVTNGIKSLASSGTNRRDGSLATLEWKPNDSFTSILDTYYTKDNQDNDRRSMEVNLGNYNGLPNGTANYSNLSIAGNTLVGATVSNVVPLARNFSYLTRDQIFAAGWNNKWKADDWSVMGDVSYSRASRDEKDYETQGQYNDGTTDTATYFLPQSSQPTFALQNSYTDPALVKVGPTIYGGGYSRFPHVKDELKSFRLEGSHSAGWWFKDVVAGVNYDDRTKDKRQPEAGLNTIGNLFYQLSPNLLLPPANLGFSGTPSSLAWNVPGVLAADFQPVVPSTNAGYLVGKTWHVSEKVTTAYVKTDLNHEISSAVTLKGNVGVQVIHTQQSSSSTFFNEVTNSPSPFSDGKNFNDVLPAANLVFDLPYQQALRLGLSREVARARMDQLAASFDFSVSQTTGIPSATAGNPRLDPWRADAFDLSYEKYFGNKAYVSAAFFFKKLKTYIYDQTINTYDFSKYTTGLPANYAQVPITSTGFLTVPLNGAGGRLDGVELTASLPLDLMTDVLSGFGVILSASQTNSSITVKGAVSGIPSSSIALPGLSKTVWSAAGYYEKYGFSARIATRYRSNYIGEIDDFSGTRALEYVRHEQITDFQTGYEFQQGPVKGLSILFQVNNLTNTPFIDYSGNPSRVRDYETFGRDFFFGFNYRR